MMPKIGNIIIVNIQKSRLYFVSFFTICDAVNNKISVYTKIAIIIAIELIFPIIIIYLTTTPCYS